MGENAHGRLKKGVFAGFFAVAVRIAFQFLQMPILYAYWPSDQATAWLLVWTLPSFIALGAGAFSTAGGNQVVLASGQGDIAGARAAFRATQLAIAMSVTVLAVLALVLLPLILDLSAWGVAPTTMYLTLLAIAAYVGATIIGSSLQVAYRHGGDYGGFGLIDGLVCLGELIVLLAVVMLSTELWLLPTCLALLRLGTALAVWRIARRRWSELFILPEPGQVRAALKALLVPFLGFMTAPLLLAVNLNGYAMLVGTLFGPALFATYLTVRTLVRLADMGINMSYSVLSLELSYWTGPDQTDRIVRFAAGAAVAGFGLCTAYAVLLLLLGSPFQQAWTLGKVSFDPALALALGLCVILRAIQTPFTALLASRNAHTLPNTIYLVATLATFGISLVSARLGASLAVVAAWQVLAEVLQLLVVGYYSAKLLERPLGGFALAIVREGPAGLVELARRFSGRQSRGLEGTK